MLLNIPHYDYKNYYFITNSMLWTKPIDIKGLYIVLCGGGAGGYYGNAGDNTAYRAGGGGGGGGAISTLLIPAHFLPPNLSITIGRGGSKGIVSPQTAPTAGGVSYIMLGDSNVYNANKCLLYARGGSISVSGVAGAGGVASTINDCYLAAYGSYTFFRGPTGRSEVRNQLTAPEYIEIYGITSGGGGGGGIGTNGATSYGSSFYPLLGTEYLVDCASNRCDPGLTKFNPLEFTGSAGGRGSSGTVVDCGDASYGSGGGGGGGSRSGPAGDGGAGGDGFAIIIGL